MACPIDVVGQNSGYSTVDSRLQSLRRNRGRLADRASSNASRLGEWTRRVSESSVRWTWLLLVPGRELLILLEYVARDMLPDIFSSATIAVMPLDDSLAARSKHSVKLLELMASGCPVIASDVGDVPRTLGAAGVLVRGSDPESFADSALELMQDSVRLESMSLAGPPRIRAAFHIRLVADSMLRAYSSC